MYIYKLVMEGGIIRPSIYKKFTFNGSITSASSLKRFMKKLRGSVENDASFFISVDANGRVNSIFEITFGFTTNDVYSKELLVAGILSASHNSIIISFIVNTDDYDEERTLQDFSQVTSAFNLLDLKLRSYYSVVNGKIHCINKLYKERGKH